MRAGGADGYGEVYGFTATRDRKSGATTIAVTPKLQSDETLVAKFPETKLRIRGEHAGVIASSAGGYPGNEEGKTVFFVPEAKEGTLYVTDRRILFLRRGIDWKAGYLAYKEGAIPTDAPSNAPSRVLACAGLEYFEIGLEDIVGLDAGFFGGSLRLEEHGRTFRLDLTRKQLRAIQGTLKALKDI